MMLTADGFADFVREVHSYDPFPWQIDLCREVLGDNGWPNIIDVPTSLGKTTVLTVATYATAAGVGMRLPRRTFLCIDRRSVVDEAYKHAQNLAAALDNASLGSVTHEVAQRLRDLTGGEGSPLEVTRMRGGMTWDRRWIRRPDQPAIIVGTIDQLGSRLFFRGYGVSERSYPIDAALVGADSLLLLDEAHLAQPFLDTLRTTQRFDQTVLPLGRPKVVTLSATPRAAAQPLRTLSFDLDKHLAEDIARKRLTAAKSARLLRCPPAEVGAVMAAAARALATKAGVRTVGVVANTVGRARAVFEQLHRQMPDRVALLTGRNRALDREQLEAEWLPHFGVDADHREGDQPRILVATQTIEVGMNLDFDALVTESAAWDALVQRLGRLNRLGTRPAGQCSAIVVAPNKSGHDLVYCGAADAAAAWIAEQDGEISVRAKTAAAGTLHASKGLDVSPLALRRMTNTVPRDAHTTAPIAPMLAPGVLDTWARTSPIPDPDVPVAPFLHGLGRKTTTVQLAWRADLDSATHANKPSVSGLLPTTAEETLELPLAALRRWLAHDPSADDLADIEGLEEQSGSDGTVKNGRLVVRLTSAGEGEWISPDRLKPGDTVLVPADYGGLDKWGWAPTCTHPVRDVADLARRGNQRVLRLDERVLAGYLPDMVADDLKIFSTVRDALHDESGHVNMRTVGRSASASLAELAEPRGADPRLRELLVAAATRGKIHSVHDNVLWLKVPTEAEGTRRPLGDIDEQNSAIIGRQVPLQAHHDAVAAAAAAYAANLALPADIQRAVRLAAGWHDLGKLDGRFQIMLHRGDPYAARAASEPLAKSGMDPANRPAFRRARELSGYLSGAQHELLSARLVGTVLAERGHDDCDVELVIHLVAAHHGYARPLLESVDDPDPDTWRVTRTISGVKVDLPADTGPDWDSPARFHRLQQRYGRWGLALLETLVRLADMSCSENGT